MFRASHTRYALPNNSIAPGTQKRRDRLAVELGNEHDYVPTGVGTADASLLVR